SYDQQRLMGLCFYVMLLQFIINFVSGNNLINIGLWIPIAMLFSTVNNFYIQTSEKSFSVSLVKEPLKLSFAKAIRKYEHMRKTEKSRKNN
ncbi:MAG: hypothetical protein Q8M94_14075, partial [Ignavibacteria bacterium]|nr:hypothetical protein [Ignavibacteria bacterium]